MRRLTQINSILTVLICTLTACSEIQFSSEEWKNWKESEAEPSLRWNMTEDLVNDYDLIGMSTDQIIKLLGEPDENKGEKEFRYYLGYSGHGIDTGSLILVLDKNTVIDYKIWHG